MLVIFTGSSGSVRAKKEEKNKKTKPKTPSHKSMNSRKSALHRWSGGSGVFHICIPGKPLGEIAGARGGRMYSPPQVSFQPDPKAPCRINSPEKKNTKINEGIWNKWRGQLHTLWLPRPLPGPVAPPGPRRKEKHLRSDMTQVWEYPHLWRLVPPPPKQNACSKQVTFTPPTPPSPPTPSTAHFWTVGHRSCHGWNSFTGALTCSTAGPLRFVCFMTPAGLQVFL